MALSAMESPGVVAAENVSISSSNRVVFHEVPAPMEQPLHQRVADAFLHGRIEPDDELQHRVEAVRISDLRREGRRRYYAIGVGRCPGMYVRNTRRV